MLQKKLMLVTAESCTGGLIGAAITDIPGSSKIYDRGFITYSNESKMDLLGVTSNVLDSHGAVSEQTAIAMAEGALRACPKSDLSVAVTGIAGPDGGTEDKPVGLVFICVASRNGKTNVYRHLFTGDRDRVRKKAVDAAFQHLIEVA